MGLFRRDELRSEFVPRSGLCGSAPVFVEATSDFVAPFALERVVLEVAVPERLQKMLREFRTRVRRERQCLLQKGVDWNRHACILSGWTPVEPGFRRRPNHEVEPMLAGCRDRPIRSPASRQLSLGVDADRLMEQVVSRANMERAWRRVRSNCGGPGVDGVTVAEYPTVARA